jgi:hypothetical protein
MHEFSLDCDKRARVMFSFGHFLFEEIAQGRIAATRCKCSIEEHGSEVTIAFLADVTTAVD